MELWLTLAAHGSHHDEPIDQGKGSQAWTFGQKAAAVPKIDGSQPRVVPALAALVPFVRREDQSAYIEQIDFPTTIGKRTKTRGKHINALQLNGRLCFLRKSQTN